MQKGLTAMVRSRLVAACSLFGWGYAAWLLLTWTVTAEQLVCGALASTVMTAILLPVMDGVVRPWILLRPRRAVATIRLVLTCAIRICRANIRLARRIWSPSRPVESGMVVVPSALTGDAGLIGVGILSSLIVDNQLVDLDRRQRLLQYHAVSVPPPGSDRAQIVTGGTESLLRPLLDDSSEATSRDGAG